MTARFDRHGAPALVPPCNCDRRGQIDSPSIRLCSLPSSPFPRAPRTSPAPSSIVVAPPLAVASAWPLAASRARSTSQKFAGTPHATCTKARNSAACKTLRQLSHRPRQVSDHPQSCGQQPGRDCPSPPRAVRFLVVRVERHPTPVCTSLLVCPPLPPTLMDAQNLPTVEFGAVEFRAKESVHDSAKTIGERLIPLKHSRESTVDKGEDAFATLW